MANRPLVLVVEDDDSSREMYSQFLESSGFSVLAARNGVEGLKVARAHHPLVILTDLSMPGIDGWQFARALRNDHRTKNVAIVAVSGLDVAEQLERNALERTSTIDSVLSKPCELGDLLLEIRKLIARSRLAQMRGTPPIANAAALPRKVPGPVETITPVQRRTR